jgi:hypothetical protein
MRPSVLLTVLKFLFSRVRKYFWLRAIVESCAESFRMDSSRTVVCSGEDPCLAGMMARAASFSTYENDRSASQLLSNPECLSAACKSTWTTYSDLKIHHLLRKGAHLIVEAEPVLPGIVCGEYKVTLSLLGSVEYDLVRGTNDRVVNVERAARLHLFSEWLATCP